MYRIDSKQISNQEIGLPLSETRLRKKGGSFRGRGRPSVLKHKVARMCRLFSVCCISVNIHLPNTQHRK